MSNKRGFTLIELLAVIIILGLILAIGVPKMNNYTSKRKMDTFITNARNIVRQLEYDNMDFKLFNMVKLSELNIVGLSDKGIDLDNSIAYVQNGEILVDLVGINQYKNMYLCAVGYSTKNIDVQKEPCSISINDLVYVDFVVNLDGGNINQSFDAKYLSGNSLVLKIPTKNNYTFSHWQIESGNSKLNNNRITFGNTSTEIKAIWVTNPSLTIDLSGGETSQNFEEQYIGGTNLTLEDPVKEGYTFNGWQLVSGNSIISGSIVTIGNINTTIRAVWTENNYLISYNLNSGTRGIYSPPSATYDTVFRLSNPTMDGYTFAGWTVISGLNTSTAKYGTSETNVTSSISSTSTKVTAEYFKNITSYDEGSVILSANWVPNVYSISYNLNGGTHGTYAPTSGTYDTVFRLSNPTRDGYTFAGWTVTSGLNSSSAKYGYSESYVTSSITSTTRKIKAEYFKNITQDSGGSVTLTANWTAN